jgi:hypothetical protein
MHVDWSQGGAHPRTYQLKDVSSARSQLSLPLAGLCYLPYWLSAFPLGETFSASSRSVLLTVLALRLPALRNFSNKVVLSSPHVARKTLILVYPCLHPHADGDDPKLSITSSTDFSRRRVCHNADRKAILATDGFRPDEVIRDFGINFLLRKLTRDLEFSFAIYITFAACQIGLISAYNMRIKT